MREWIGRCADFGAHGALMAEVSIEDPMQMCNFLRMTSSSFEELLVKIGPHIAKQTTNMRDPISIEERHGVALRY